MSEEQKQTFTCEQVVNLAHYQMDGMMHPFTCPNRSFKDHGTAYGDLGALVATVRGWICPFCDYTQTWAHQFMLKYNGEGPRIQIFRPVGDE